MYGSNARRKNTRNEITSPSVSLFFCYSLLYKYRKEIGHNMNEYGILKGDICDVDLPSPSE